MSSRNNPILLLLIACWLPVVALAQQSTISFVNALPTSDPVEILYRGVSVRPFPFGQGDISAAFEVPAGPFSFSVKGYGPSLTNFTSEVPEAGKLIVVVYEKAITDKDTGEITKELAIKEVPGLPASGSSVFRAIVLGQPKPLLLSLNGKSTTLQPDTVSSPQSSGLSFTVKIPTQSDPFTISVEDAGSYLLIIFNDSTGAFKHTITNG